MSPTEAIRIYLAYLTDKRILAEAKSSAFAVHWLSYAEFDQLKDLLSGLFDLLDASTKNIRPNTGTVCANSEPSEASLWTNCVGTVRELESLEQ